jgi:PST family polysaccharide transporter/lipopolysaccharide exporter
LESFGAWLIVWGDNFIVGRFLGVHELGVYRTGWMLVTIIFGLVLNPFLPLIYPTFSRLQDDLPALKNTFHRVNRVVFALALPIGTGLLLTGPEVAAFLFGDKWHGLGFVLSILGFMHTIAWLVATNTELYRAMGRADVNTKLMFFTLLYYLPAYYISAQFGLEIFTMTRFMIALVAMPIHIYLCVKMLKVSPFYIWKDGKPMIISTICMAAGVAIFKWGILQFMPMPYAFLSIGVLICTGCIIYLACLWILDQSFILQTKNLLKKAAV